MKARRPPPARSIHEKIDLDGLLTRALDLSDYHVKKTSFAEFNAASTTEKKGIGFATFMHGAGFTGSGEVYLSSIVGIEATRDRQRQEF